MGRRRGRPYTYPLLAMTALLTVTLTNAATATPPNANKAWGATPKGAKRASPTLTVDAQVPLAPLHS